MRMYPVGTRSDNRKSVTASTGRRVVAAAVLGCLVASLGVAVPVQARGRGSKARLRQVFEIRTTYTADFGLASPSGIAYDPAGKELLLAGRGENATRLARVATSEDYLGAMELPEADARTLAFDARRSRIVLLAGREVVIASPGGTARARARTQRRSLRGVGLRTPTATAFHSSGDLMILDAARRSVVRVDAADPSRELRRIRLAGVDEGVRALAFNPNDGLLYVMSPRTRRLYALDSAGRLRRTYTLESLRLRDPRAITFAPSADTTDDPRNRNLFIADGKGDAASGSIVEVRLTRITSAEALAVTAATANLVQVIDTSLFSPASPDPAGIVHMPGVDRLATADSEVNEITGAGYHGVNLWQSTRAGTVLDVGTTLAYTNEPTGLGFDDATGTLFVSSDDTRSVYAVKAGADGRFGTSDDVVSLIDVGTKYGVTDAEDPEFDPASGHLFFADGVSTEIYRIDPVNGVFGDDDDVMTHFDVGQYGATDIEGLGSDAASGTLLAGDRRQRTIYEVTKTGELVRTIDVRVPGMTHLSGLAMAPASNGSGSMNYWIVDRGVDNGPDPTENDGKIFEVTLDSGTNEAPVVNSVTIDQAAPKTNDTLTATVSASDADGDALTYSYQWNRNGSAIPGATGATLNLSVAGNGDRGDAISLRVTASDGMALAVRTSAQVTVGNSAPAFQQDLADRTSAEGESAAFSAAASDVDGDLLRYEATGLPPGVTIDPATGDVSGTVSAGAASGSPYDVSVTVTDDGTSPPPEGAIGLVQEKSGDQPATTGNSVSLTFDAPPTQGNLLVAFGHNSANRTPTIPNGWTLAAETGSSAETVVFFKVAGPSEPSTVTYSVSGTAVFMGLAIFEYAGLNNVQSEVLDRVAFTSASSVNTISTGTTQPTRVADELLLASVSLNVTRTFQSSWTNGFTPETVTSRQTIASRVVSATGEFETSETWGGNPAAATGVLVTFRRPVVTQPPDSDFASATDTFTWSVTPAGGGGNQAPVVEAVTVAPNSPATNDTVGAQVVASDPDGDALSYTYEWRRNGTAVAGATGPSLDLAVAGNGDKGDAISVRVTASDGSTTSAAVTSPSVTVVNSAPVFHQNLGDRADNEGDAVSLSAAAADADGDDLGYEASGLPTGLSINPSTGLISGTVAAGAAAASPYSVTITARDDTSAATDTLTWTVTGATVAPPGALRATPTTTSMFLRWTGSSDSEVAGYNVYRSDSATGPFTKLNASPLTSSSFKDKTAPRGTSYYRVTAEDRTGGESSPAETFGVRLIVFRSLGKASVKAARVLEVPAPSRVAAGDLLVAALGVRGGGRITMPSGWSLVRKDSKSSALRQAVYVRVAASDEPASYPWRFSTNASAVGNVLAYEGAAATEPIVDGHSGRARKASTSIVAPSVFTTVPHTLLVGFFGVAAKTQIAEPRKMWERGQIVQRAGSRKLRLEVADAILEQAGASRKRTASAARARINIGQLVAVRPQ